MSNEQQATKTSVQGGTTIHWDDSKMATSYANVCNVAVTRDELMLLFGTSQAWMNPTDEVRVVLSNRILLTPHAAKRLAGMLLQSLGEYEKAYGSLD
jgi:hypothetical protein